MDSTLLFDIRCAVRGLRRSSFSAIVIVTVALGIGASTAMFSVATALLLRPLPYENPDRLISLSEISLAEGSGRVPLSAPSFVAWKAQSRTVARMAAYRPWGYVLTGYGEPERLLGVRASADFLPLLGATPIHGRTFTADEDGFGQPRVAVLSDGLWQRRFGGDPNAVGRSLTLNDESYTIVGIVARDSALLDADIWVPLALEPFALQQRGNRALAVIGRLDEGTTIEQAQAEMHAIALEQSRRFPDGSAGWDAAVIPLTEHVVGSIRPTVLIVWAAVTLVLLIACANAINLLLARSSDRQHELALCLALGASRWRLTRRMLAESVVLALCGAAAALPIAAAVLWMLASLRPASLARIDHVTLDANAIAFALALALCAGIVLGLVAALWSVRRESSPLLPETASWASPNRCRSTLRSLSLASQLAFATVVLIASGLLVRSFNQVMAVDRGFSPDRVLTMTLSLSGARYNDPARRAALYGEVVDRVESLPGVVSASLTSHLPLGGRRLDMDVAPEGRASSAAGTLWADSSVVGDDYFDVMGIPLLAGRVFSAIDTMRSVPVVIVNKQMADRLWPDGRPIGRRLVVGKTTGADQRPREVIGVVADVRSASLEAAPGFQIYSSVAQNPWPTMTLTVRAADDPRSIAGAVRRALLAVDPNQPLYNIRPFEEVVSRAVASRRFQMSVLAAFAMVGLALAVIGVYGVAACTVRLRTREIGVRLAIGARRRDVVWLMIRSSLTWVASGILAGLLAGFGVGQLLRGLLIGIAPVDPLTFAAVTSIVGMLVLAATGLAARRAANIDPLIALREN